MAHDQLQSTRTLIESLAAYSCSQESSPLFTPDFAAQLILALQEDGFQPNLKNPGNTVSRSLRGLAEASEDGSVNATAIVMVIACIICAGLASGLTQGLLSLDLMDMEIKARSGTVVEKSYAAKLIPIISRHHLLLVTLMLWNASATEALPIFLAALVPEYVAIIISVTLVLFVGEIIPASILTGPNQLKITAALSPLVYFVLFIFFPIAYPISIALDHIIGHSDMTLFNRTEISTMMRLHMEEGMKRQTMHHGKNGHQQVQDNAELYDEEEVNIIAGALKYRELQVDQVMTPAAQAYMISVADTLNYKLIYEIFKSGYSRIPVFERDRHDVVGLILAKDLIFIDPEDETPVRSFLGLFGRKPAVVWHDNKLGETLNMFRQEKSHMAIVRDVECEGKGDPVYKVVGIITLEDIVEEILGTEIEDETDAVIDERSTSSAAMRDPELVRLHIKDTAKVAKQALRDEEVQSIGIFLFTNVPQVQRRFRDNMSGLHSLVSNSAVVTMTRKAAAGEKPHPDDFLYRKGKVSTLCALILEGVVEVVEVVEDDAAAAGSGRLRGPWTILAVEALETPEGTFISHFSAMVHSDTIRFLHMSQFTLSEALGGAGGADLSPPPRQLKVRAKSQLDLKTTSSDPLVTVSGSSSKSVQHSETSPMDWADSISYSIAPFRARTHGTTTSTGSGKQPTGAAGGGSAGPDTLSPMHAQSASSSDAEQRSSGKKMQKQAAGVTYAPFSVQGSFHNQQQHRAGLSGQGRSEEEPTRNPLLAPSNYGTASASAPASSVVAAPAQSTGTMHEGREQPPVHSAHAAGLEVGRAAAGGRGAKLSAGRRVDGSGGGRSSSSTGSSGSAAVYQQLQNPMGDADLMFMDTESPAGVSLEVPDLL